MNLNMITTTKINDFCASLMVGARNFKSKAASSILVAQTIPKYVGHSILAGLNYVLNIPFQIPHSGNLVVDNHDPLSSILILKEEPLMLESHIEFLRIKRDYMAYELRRIRRAEINARKWQKRIKENYQRQAGARQFEYKQRRAYNPELRESLKYHRTQELRPEARAAHIALGFIRNVPYRAIEAIAETAPLWKKVWHNCLLGGIEDTQENRDKFMAWVDVIPTTITPKHNQKTRDYAIKPSTTVTLPAIKV